MADNTREQIEDRWIELQMKSMYPEHLLREYKEWQDTGCCQMDGDQTVGMANFEYAMSENVERMSYQEMVDDIAVMESE